MRFKLETADGDIWYFETLDDARRSQYIFGGKITEEKGDNE
jgi:hypothetical protein